MSQLRTIRLYGKLGARFGRVHRFHLDTNTPAEAIRALDSQQKGFRAWLMSSKDHGVTYAVFAGKKNLGRDDLKTPVGDEDIRIAPVLIGSKSGVLQTILGAVLIVVGVVLDAFSYGTAGNLFITAGISMMAGGVLQMLSPQPKGNGGNESSNNPSYIFNGAVNTEAQGHPVPLLYGRMMVGSAVISAGIEADDYALTANPVGTGTVNGNAKINYYETQQ